jgi:hypothetical protein
LGRARRRPHPDRGRCHDRGGRVVSAKGARHRRDASRTGHGARGRFMFSSLRVACRSRTCVSERSHDHYPQTSAPRFLADGRHRRDGPLLSPQDGLGIHPGKIARLGIVCACRCSAGASAARPGKGASSTDRPRRWVLHWNRQAEAVVSLQEGGLLPARVAPGPHPVTLTASAVLPTGNGTLRWAPDGQRPVVSWDFAVEVD